MQETFFNCLYIGDGKGDGFVRHNQYTLKIDQKWFGSKIRIVPTSGYHHSSILDYETVYNNIEHFLDNWKFISFEREDLWANKITTQQPDL